MPANNTRKRSLASVVKQYNNALTPRVPFVRKRTLSALSGTGNTGTVIGTDPVYVSFGTPHPYNLVAKQVTTSFENPGWVLLKRMKRNPRYRGLPRRLKPIENRNFGSPFTTERQRYWGSHDTVQTCLDISPGPAGYLRRVYRGPIFAWRSTNTGATSGFPSLTAVSEMELISRGTKFISQTIPTNPVAGVATFLGELREGLPKIPGRAVWRAQNIHDLSRQAGSEYLNVQFGILPMVGDVVKMARAVKSSEKIISQYVRDSGRHIRRKASLPTVTTTEITTIGPATTSPPIHSSFYGNVQGVMTRTRVTTTKWSFSACYSYYLDPGKTSLGRFKRSEQIANKLLGTRITPEVLWELTPWSWAADYVGNIGDVLTNVSALMADSLVIRWAYVMCEQRVTDTYTTTGVSFKRGPSGPFSQTFETVRKVRRQATPYGFGLDPDAFSSRQWAILGALGMSKGPRQL